MGKLIALAMLTFMLSFVGTKQSFAWGEFGHLTVCDLAYRNLTETSRENLKKLFHVDSGGISVKARDGTEKRHYTSFNVGCLEEDAVPRKHPLDHYVNVSRDTTEIPEASCPLGGKCIFEGIERDLGILKDTSKTDEERVFALMAVGHWIGDIHQPLHISFADDRGGNRIKVKPDGKCGSSKYRPKDLHAAWDNCLLEAGLFERVRQRADFKKSWGKRTITYRAVDTLLANTTLTEEKQMVGTDPAVWANESYQITLRPDVGYCVKVGDKCQYKADQAEYVDEATMRKDESIGQNYLLAFKDVAAERVRLAGFRLAHLVNLALDPAYGEPVQNAAQRP